MRNRRRSSNRNTRKTYRQGKAAVDATNRLAAELAHLPLTVRQNGYGFRIDCNLCGWSTTGIVQGAIDHAEAH